MEQISTDLNIQKEIATAGYSLVRATELCIADELRQAWLSLQIDYADLPADEYLPGGATYRYRRYGRFSFTPESGSLTRLPHEDYFQSADINAVTGGYVRKFAPLLDGIFANPFLQALIRFDFAQFPLEAEGAAGEWEVHVHLIRVTAEAGQPGHPTPEGIHRDGAAFVTVHLAELVNASGGGVSIYDDDRKLLTSFRLRQEMDSYLLQRCRLVARGRAHPAARSGARRAAQHTDLRLPSAAGALATRKTRVRGSLGLRVSTGKKGLEPLTLCSKGTCSAD